ncbi:MULTISPECIES: YeeE/YedE family protein [Bradyrhizobium]|uniref:Membrane protein YedE/YeeE n=1 Tax=Bradyrhizobium ottawaense TaxID=931866 RepID=A0ABV4FYR4_9BRAD|nr:MULTISPECIES: YeeE/YedE family protein [Bradyrhizobium]MBR1293696.1 YeeE/YedE family protein [Bradyrhizobium ottawaense]MDA9418276.1 mmembrane protein [Bradyrhizobium sp. CCBAU 25360]MDA9484950.1 mmembrane protein [Bradyrhizobium sp. CCBAU 11445]WLB48971.1 YeeE/YedE family protein [Bradyrhizobium ottawaense]WQN86293.1 YeeE/YedE family protein [Bradyrhizobium ottawaense]
MLSPSTIAFACGLAAGAVLGVAGRAGRFCTLAMLEDAFFGSDFRRLKSFALAAAVALLATQALAAFGIVDLSRSIYLTASIGLGGAIIGGLMFGVGMALVGTCGFGTLVRVGGGDLRAIVVFLVLGLSALATMRGITGMLRLMLIEPLSVRLPEGSTQTLTSLLGAGSAMRAILVVAISAALAFWALADGRLIRSPRLLASGLTVGAAIAFGWFATGWLADDEFDPARVSSLSFVAPLGDAILYVATFSGARLNFGIGSVAGVVAGSFAAAMLARGFRWEACDDARELKRHMIGALLMGIGGIMSMGCTIGQGLSALSTLAVSAPVTMLAIACGARLGLEFTMTGEWLPAVRRLFGVST